MTGQEVIDFIQKYHLENSPVTVTATMYYNGDHACRTTEDVDITTGSVYRGRKTVETVNFYVDSNLY